MRVSNRKRLAAAAAMALVAVGSASNAAVIEFSEVAVLPGTSLAGTEAFAALGVHFDGSAMYVQDNIFTPGAGADTSGITTTISNINMGVLFDAGATTVSFKGLAVNTDFYANVYDASNVLLDSYFAASTPGVGYRSHTFSGVGTIAKIEFHDNNQFIGVGQIEFTPVPEPTGIVSLGAVCLAGLCRRQRRV